MRRHSCLTFLPNVGLLALNHRCCLTLRKQSTPTHKIKIEKERKGRVANKRRGGRRRSSKAPPSTPLPTTLIPYPFSYQPSCVCHLFHPPTKKNTTSQSKQKQNINTFISAQLGASHLRACFGRKRCSEDKGGRGGLNGHLREIGRIFKHTDVPSTSHTANTPTDACPHTFLICQPHTCASQHFSPTVCRALSLLGCMEKLTFLKCLITRRGTTNGTKEARLFLSGRAHWNALAETSFLPHIPI